MLSPIGVLEMVDAGVNHPLTLISAPPGAGKTALLAHWFNARDAPGPAVWLPLRREHTDRRRFWAGVVSALGGTDLQLAGLAAPPRDALEPFLVTLLVWIAASVTNSVKARPSAITSATHASEHESHLVLG